MKFTSNQPNKNLELQDLYLTYLIDLERKKKLEKDNSEQFGQIQKNTMIKTSENKSGNDSDSKRCISGLNNLGNTCFFNAVLQNLAQTCYLDEILKERQSSIDEVYSLRHNDEYDSELTEHEESDTEEEKAEKKTETKIDKSITKTNYLSDESDSEDDHGLNNGYKKKSKNAVKKVEKYHRSIRLDEVKVVLKEPPGVLGRELNEAIKKMTGSWSVVNPSAVFSNLCKKVPSFKGFQQQDSHELLRNLLDAVKTEELKRRQAAILEIFKIKKSIGLDEKTKKKIKRYGRLASYTFVDQIFGGHLLSSIVCEECRTCVQRVEPFLDLSLPISTDEQKASNFKDSNDDSHHSKNDHFNKHSKNAKKISKNDKKRQNSIEENEVTKESDKVVEFMKQDKQLSKHMTKKQQKIASKKAKKARKNSAKSEEQLENGDKKEVNIETEDSVDEKSKPGDELELDKLETLEKVIETEELDENESEKEAEVAENKENSVENENSVEDLIKPIEESRIEPKDEVSQNLNISNDLSKEENDFRLEAMKSMSSLINETIDETSGCSLQQCLNKFTSNEILQDKINCENCTKVFNAKRKTPTTQNVYSRATKQYLLCDLPAILTIHLKRFQQYGFRLEKSNKQVNFPLVLDMSPYTSKMCANLFVANQPVLYSLYGLVEHSGKLNSGHYTAFVRQTSRLNEKKRRFLGAHRLCNLRKIFKQWKETNDENNNGDKESLNLCDSSVYEAIGLAEEEEKWFYISDSRVTETCVSKVLKAQAYILFYERIQ